MGKKVPNRHWRSLIFWVSTYTSEGPSKYIFKDILKLKSVRFSFVYFIPKSAANSWYSLLFPPVVVHCRIWQIGASFFFLLLPSISCARAQPLLLPTPFSVSPPVLSCQHHFNTDESPDFTCLFHFPYVAAISLLCLLLKRTILMSKSASWKLNFLSFFFPILTPLPLLLTMPLSFSIL